MAELFVILLFDTASKTLNKHASLTCKFTTAQSRACVPQAVPRVDNVLYIYIYVCVCVYIFFTITTALYDLNLEQNCIHALIQGLHADEFFHRSKINLKVVFDRDFRLNTHRHI